jgi:cytochrome P450
MGAAMVSADEDAREAEALYPPFLEPPPEPLSLPGYFLNFVRNPLGAMPAVVYREPIFQYRGRLTYVTDPPLIKRILLDEFADFPKTIVERYVFTALLGKGILTAHGAEWRWQRQAAAPLFRHAEIQHYAPIMTQAAERAIADWRQLADGSQRLVDQDTTRAAFSVIAETMLHSNDPAVTAALERANRDYLLPLSWPGVYGVLGLPEWLPYPRRAARRAAERDMRESVGSLVKERRAQSDARTDLMTRLLAAKDPETGQTMADEQMVDNLLTFLLAGHETSAKSLAWMLYLVALSPAWEQRLLAEVTRVAGDTPIGAQHVDLLTDTAMFIKEAMRLYPPISSLARVATRDVDLGGMLVKKGNIIVMPIFAIHRHKRLWEDPARFDPERFLPEREAKQVRYQYMPFGAGPRVCIGASFATLEATIMLASFVRAARFEVPAGHVAVPLSRIALQPKGGMPLKIRMRQSG